MKQIIFLLLLCFAFSCKTTKTKTEQQMKTVSAAKLDVSTSSILEEVKKLEVKIVDKSTANEVTTWETNMKTFSAPDSTGKQHLQSETSTKGKTVKGAQSDVISNIKDSAQAVKKDVSSDNSKLKTIAKTTAKSNIVEKIESPGWVIWGIVAAVLGVLGIGYLGLKKYKIL